MSKLWLIEVTREIEEQFNFHMEQDTEPTREEIVKELAENHDIHDDPDYTKYEVTLVQTTSEKIEELQKFLKDFAQNYTGEDGGKFSPEDFQQDDTLLELQADFMYDVMNIMGYVKHE